MGQDGIGADECHHGRSQVERANLVSAQNPTCRFNRVVSLLYDASRQHRNSDAADAEGTNQDDGHAAEVEGVDENDHTLVAHEEPRDVALAQRIHGIAIP